MNTPIASVLVFAIVYLAACSKSEPPTQANTTPPAPIIAPAPASERVVTQRIALYDDKWLPVETTEVSQPKTDLFHVEMARINAYLAHAWNGMNWLRPWNGEHVDRRKLFPEIP